MTIEEAVNCLMKRGFAAKAIKNNTEIFGCTNEIPMGDIIGTRNAFLIYPDEETWITGMSVPDKSVRVASLVDAVQVVIDLVSPLLNKPDEP